MRAGGAPALVSSPAVDSDRLASIDRELDAFGISASRLDATRAAASAVRAALSADELDGELAGLAVHEVPISGVSSSAEPVARPTTWDEQRKRRSESPSGEGSGVLDVDERVLRDDSMPPVLSIETGPVHMSSLPPESIEPPRISVATALYIDPPTNPPPSSPIEPALDLDPEAGLVEPGAAPLSYVPPPPKPKTQPPPRPSSVPQASTDEMLAEMLDAPEEPPAPPPPLPVRPSVAESETEEALAAISAGSLSASLDRDASDAFDASLDAAPFGEDGDIEQTVMVKSAALLPPAGDEADGDFVIDIDDDVMVIDEEESSASSSNAKSRPPPPPPSKRPSTRPLPGSTPPSRSRPPEPPGKGFLSKLLKSNKP